MRDLANIAGVIAAASPDYLGFIFYPLSKRFVGLRPLPEVLAVVPDSVKKVGVFVDETPETVWTVSEQWKLEVIQLHGKESPEVCEQLKVRGLIVIKAFSVDESFDFSTLEAYLQSCDFFLFDTKGLLPGGTGQKFNWHLLSNYQLDKPFFLSGGIGPDDLNTIREYSHPQLLGIDINSGFEISPALKDVSSIRKFISEIRNNKL
jgi:phosphoribosylanthranilate isomerase